MAEISLDGPVDFNFVLILSSQCVKRNFLTFMTRAKAMYSKSYLMINNFLKMRIPMDFISRIMLPSVISVSPNYDWKLWNFKKKVIVRILSLSMCQQLLLSESIREAAEFKNYTRNSAHKKQSALLYFFSFLNYWQCSIKWINFNSRQFDEILVIVVYCGLRA